MRISISVPTPCHENWNAMTPAGTGRHCDRCQHTVMDLTQASDRQLIDLFRADAMPKCARFAQSQLDRVIALEERTPRLLPAAAVGAALALGASSADAQDHAPTVGKMAITRPVDIPQVGQMLVEPLLEGTVRGNAVVTGDTVAMQLGSCEPGEVAVRDEQMTVMPHSTPLPIDDIEHAGIIPGVRTDFHAAPQDLFVIEMSDTITGRVLDSQGKPFPLANVRVRGTALRTVTDADGRYRITLPPSICQERCTLTISAVGYSTREVEVPAFAAASDPDACVYNDKAPLTGRAARPDGKGACGVVVELVEMGTRCITNANGYFSFDRPTDGMLETITLAITDKDGSARAVKLRTEALPCSVPIVLAGKGDPATITRSKIDLGDTKLEEGELMFLGEFAIDEVHQDTLLARAARPFRWMGERIGRVLR